MAHDLDFRRKHKTKPIASQNRKLLFAKTKKSKRSAIGSITSFVAIIAIAAVGYFAYTKSMAPANQMTQRAELSSSTIPSITKTLTINIYDGGAGEAKTKDEEAKLIAAGYKVNNLGTAQFQYDKTYIWYQKNFAPDATQVSTVLNDRIVQTAQSQVGGLFDILIYLGQK